MTKAILTPEQQELAAKFFAASNTGLIGCGHKVPENSRDINYVYANISGDYAAELGEGLEEELKMWKKDMAKVTSTDNSWYKKIEKEIPFILVG